MKILAVVVAAAMWSIIAFAEPIPDPKFDPQLQPLITSFIADAKAFGLRPGNLIWGASFGDLEHKNWAGQCETWSLDDGFFYMITINPLIKNDPLVLKLVMYHELGHCIYLLNHSPNPKDIMYKQAHRPLSEQELKTALKDLFFAAFERE